VNRMFIEVAITRILRIQKKEGTEGKKNTLYIVVTQACASPKGNVLQHKEGVGPEDVCDTKKCVCLEGNGS